MFFISDIISTALLALGRIAGAAVSAAGRLPQHKPFELSDDGEFLFSGGERYDFVGFCEDARYTVEPGETTAPGRRLGYIVGDSTMRVRQLPTRKGTYVAVKGAADCSEIYRLCE